MFIINDVIKENRSYSMAKNWYVIKLNQKLHLLMCDRWDKERKKWVQEDKGMRSNIIP